MTMDILTQRLSEYSLTVLAPKAKSWSVKFAIGAGSVAMVKKVPPLVVAAGALKEDGEIDMTLLHDAVKAGFDVAGHLDLMGGMIGFDPQDAEELFTWLGN